MGSHQGRGGKKPARDRYRYDRDDRGKREYSPDRRYDDRDRYERFDSRDRGPDRRHDRRDDRRDDRGSSSRKVVSWRDGK